MWSDSYRDYVASMVKSNRGEYPYYIAHTCTYWGISNSGSLPAFKIYFSKEPITASSLYNYVLPSDTLVYSVVGSNANSNYHSARVTATVTSGKLNINDYEFVYTNAESSTATIQPDILADTAVTRSHFDGVSLVLLIVVLASVVVKLIRG